MTVVVRNRCRFLAILFFICCHAVSFGQLSAHFSASAKSGCSPLVVNFRDSSAGNPTQWRWELGNGVTSLLQHPSTTYFNPGTYPVKLVIKNAAGNADSLIKTDYITVYSNPTADFSADRLMGCFPLNVNFTDASIPGTGTITNWFWDFGDGNTSTQQNPSHVYTGAGNFTVTLRITNSFGCTKTFTKPQYITISDGVSADFTNVSIGLCAAPVAVNFTNTSTGPGPLTYSWNFGDGNTSTATNPAHTYASNGIYTVSLIAVSPQGCSDTITKTDLLTIGNFNADFTSPDTFCVNEVFLLTNTSSPAPVASSWNFGDGNASVLTNPALSYASPGTYNIKLVSNFDGCLDSVTKAIYVSPRPQPQFDAVQKVFCSVPATVQFTNQTAGAGTVLWDFGDGDTSTQNNPTHVYSATGNYTVTLTVTNAAGCSETIIRNDFIQIETPQLTINNLPANGCVPVMIAPTVTVTSNHTITGYLWKFGDGSTSASATPAHSYTSAGTYDVTLVYTTASGCTDSIVIPNAVRVGTKPTAAFSVNPTNVCAYQAVSFTDNSTGGVDQWQWTFNDGGVSTAQNPVHHFGYIGWFDVQLIVYNNTCPDTMLLTNAVHVKPPVADFSIGNSCTDKYTKTFTDESIGATTWFWNFGDGATSTQQSPTHTYAATGTYQVTLTVSNDTCANSYTQTIRVINENALFTTADTVICRNGTASFMSTGIDSANITSWTWNFGDGTWATTDSSAAHVYTTSGNYTVSLAITDLLGCSDNATLPIKVYGPTADFSVSAAVSCLPDNLVTFTNLSTSDGLHPVVRWEWTYGDGTTDTTGTAPYQHSYTTAGDYTVSLLVKDRFGCSDVIARPAAVIISQPKADFFSVDTITCTGSPITFTNTSTGTGLQHAWSFGDGHTATTTDPVHNYASIGTYSIELIVTDQYGCKDTLDRPDYISISYPQAKFTISDSVSTCPPLLVNFAHQSTDYTSLSWDFGDGTTSILDSPSHFYTTAGIYYAILTVRGPGGCTDTAMKRIEIKGPSGNFTYSPLSGCKPLTVNFVGTAKNNATYTWDFADGTILVTPDSLVSHTYTNAGDYLPKLILTDVGGCSVPISGTDMVHASGVTTGFTLAPATFCNDGTVQFNNTTVSNDLITRYDWNFGDGNSSTAQHPSHYYAAPGIYTVSLLVTTQNGCRDSLTLTDTVKVNANPVVAINHDPSGCTPVTVQFNGVVLSGDAQQLTWDWDFGNGKTDTVQNPATQVYTVANAYTVTTTVTDEHGCKDTTSTIINVYPIPVVDAGPDVFVCEGAFTQLTATGAATYQWMPSTSLSCTACPSPLAAPTDTTKYYVTGTTQFGCSASDSVLVGVHHRFNLQVGIGDTVCSGNLVHLRATGADQYTWVPSTAVANPNVGITTATPTTTTLYQVIARDNYNCFTETAYVNIKVWQYPTVDAGADKKVAVGTTLTLQPIYSNDIVSYQWNNPMQTLSCTTCPAPTVQTKGEQNTYSVKVENEGGCAARDEVTINTICGGGNLFIPNTFSPNADGKNDKFYPRGSGLNKIKSLRIYDRWGEVVFVASNFEANDASIGWDGTYKGKVLPPDVYVYTCEVVCINNEVLTYNGNVTLLR
jgi:gliding motility-associated-like protein